MANHNHDPSSSENILNKLVSRRTALGLGGAAVGAGVVAACAGETSGNNPTGKPGEGNQDGGEDDTPSIDFVPCGIDKETILGLVPDTEKFVKETAFSEQEWRISQLLVAGGYNPDLARGYYPVSDGNGTFSFESIEPREGLSSSLTIPESTEQLLAVLDIVKRLLQDPDEDIRKVGAAIADVITNHQTATIELLNEYETGPAGRDARKYYGFNPDGSSTEALISGIDLVETMATNPDGLQELAPWWGKEITIDTVSTIPRSVVVPDRYTEADCLVLTGGYTDAQGVVGRVALVVQPEKLNKDISSGGLYNGIDPADAFDKHSATSIRYRLVAFENVEGEKPKFDELSGVHPLTGETTSPDGYLS